MIHVICVCVCGGGVFRSGGRNGVIKKEGVKWGFVLIKTSVQQHDTFCYLFTLFYNKVNNFTQPWFA